MTEPRHSPRPRSLLRRIHTWPAVAVVAAGGVIGSAARACIGLAIPPVSGGLPTSTLIVNVGGSFLLGVFVSRRERSVGGRHSVRFWAIGVLGSFTTFSTFTVDLVRLLRDGAGTRVAIYLLVSLVGGLGSASIGLRIGAWSR